MSSPAVPHSSRMLKKSASGVLASLRGSTYRLGKRLFIQAMGGRVKTVYASPLRSLRPCWTAFLSILRVLLIPSVTSKRPDVLARKIVFQQPVKSEAGFTLVEILVAVALLGIIGAMVLGSLVMTTNAVEAGRDHVAKEQAIRRILRLMAEEISLSKRNTMYPWVGKNGTQDGQPADILAILAMSQEVSTRDVKESELVRKESETVRVVYTRERDRLIRFVRRNLYTLTDTNESLDQMELADQVQAFNIRYYDDQNRIWIDEWPAVPKIPKALLIEVTFLYPDAAPWTVREWVAIGAS